jgi:hypothetical protein
LFNILIEFVVPTKLVRLIKMCLNETYSKARIGKHLSDIVHLHPVAHRYFTFTFLVPSLCVLSMFKTLNSVFSTCHFIKIFKTLFVSASIGHPQVLKNVCQENCCDSRYSCPFAPLSSVSLLPCFLACL